MKHTLTPEMMAESNLEAERYLDQELNEFFQAARTKYDINVANGMAHCVLVMGIAKMLTAETQACLGGELSKADRMQLKTAVDAAIDTINRYRAAIRLRASGSLNCPPCVPSTSSPKPARSPSGATSP